MAREQSTALAVHPQRESRGLLVRMAEQYEMDPRRFAATIKSTCIKGNASDEQFAAFLMVAEKYGLNPLTKEIYAFPQDGGIVPIVGVDGWARIINDHPHFDGMAFQDQLDDSGALVAITCRMFRKDRGHPTEATEYMEECKRNTQPWKQWPSRMLRHKAMIQAARYAFGYTGIVDIDEYERRHDRAEQARKPMSERFADAKPVQLEAMTADSAPDIDAAIDAFIKQAADIADLSALAETYEALQATAEWSEADQVQQDRARQCHEERARALLEAEAEEAGGDAPDEPETASDDAPVSDQGEMPFPGDEPAGAGAEA
jgi:phage recombination protein Bet